MRAVERYSRSAKIEADILKEIKKRGGCSQFIVDLLDEFMHESSLQVQNKCLVFEPLGKSLYDFIKANHFQGFELS